jgi:hypothetical protein
MLRASFRPGLLVLFVSVGFLLQPGARAQSLGEAAQREKARRQAAPKKPVRTFGDADLPRSSGEGSTEEASAGAASFTPGTPQKPKADAPSQSGVSPSGLPDDPEARRQLERTWKARFVEARANLRAADARAWRTKIDVVWRGGIPYQTEVREKVETEELKQAKQALEDLEEEFRRTGLPAGWSRD